MWKVSIHLHSSCIYICVSPTMYRCYYLFIFGYLCPSSNNKYTQCVRFTCDIYIIFVTRARSVENTYTHHVFAKYTTQTLHYLLYHSVERHSFANCWHSFSPRHSTTTSSECKKIDIENVAWVESTNYNGNWTHDNHLVGLFILHGRTTVAAWKQCAICTIHNTNTHINWA